MNAPFLESTFLIQRKISWKNLSKAIKELSFSDEQKFRLEFHEKFDGEFLEKVVKKMR